MTRVGAVLDWEQLVFGTLEKQRRDVSVTEWKVPGVHNFLQVDTSSSTTARCLLQVPGVRHKECLERTTIYPPTTSSRQA